jgi:hypothetical protein
MKLTKNVMLMALILAMSAGMVFAGGQGQGGTGSAGGGVLLVLLLPRRRRAVFPGKKPCTSTGSYGIK